ncbi:MAG: glycosyltransferase, partial [Promethearchaeota archaeon]
MKLIIIAPEGPLKDLATEQMISFSKQAWQGTIIIERRQTKLKEIIRLYEPELVFNSGLVLQPSTVNYLMEKFPNVLFLNINHETAIQLDSLEHKLKNYKNKTLCIREPETFNTILGPSPEKKKFLPYYMPLETSFIIRHPPSVPTVGIFLRDTPLKNPLIQLGAALKSQAQRIIMTEMKSVQGLLNNLTRSSIKEVVFVKYTKRNSFWDILKQCSLILQVSASESFGMTALEAMSMAIPCIGSWSLDVVPSRWRCSVDDPNEIAEKINQILKNIRFWSA